MKEIRVGSNEAGQRLDKLCIKFIPLAGKGFIYKMLRKKNITLNDRKASGYEIISIGDIVKFWMSDETIAKFQEHTTVYASSIHIPDVIYEDGDVIIFNKPAGMLSQKAHQEDVSLNELLISYLIEKECLTEGDLRTFRPSICNRLDRNTSGLVICGKSLKGLQETACMLKDRTIHKDYIAFAKGRITEGMSLKGYLSKDHTGNIVKIGNEGDRIETDIKPLWTDGKYSIVIVRLITGKTHQIRAHLASVGHPILGDSKYGDGKGAERQLLHAYRITLPDKRTFIAPLPEDMKWELGKLGAFEDLPWRI